MYAVHFVGLNYFNACRVGGEDVLVTEWDAGQRRTTSLPQHFAVCLSKPEQCDFDDWWPGEKHIRPIQLEIKLGEFARST